MDDTIAVALKVVAVRMRRLGIAASAGVFYAHRVVGEHEQSLAAWSPPRRRENLLRALRISIGCNQEIKKKIFSATSASWR
jgi:hypothetical protein